MKKKFWIPAVVLPFALAACGEKTVSEEVDAKGADLVEAVERATEAAGEAAEQGEEHLDHAIDEVEESVEAAEEAISDAIERAREANESE